MMNTGIFKSEEMAVFALRSLYRQYGYLPFKMSKFEEYDLYVQNKEFLVSDRVITFTDTSGRLLALKPDVTLSIIKNTTDEAGCKQKVYYDENVYRVSGSTHQFKEIMQTGLECIGDLDINDIFEVVYLAAKSLSLISEEYIVDLSHMGIISAILNSASDDELFKREAMALIGEKNAHEARALCQRYQIKEKTIETILSIISMHGAMDEVLPRLEKICEGDAASSFNELKTLCELLCKTELGGKIKLDFSVVNDMSYYNGIVFKGFLNGIPESALSGGEYGKLLKRMNRKSDAIGFAIYLDLLEGLDTQKREYDVDTLLIYDESTSPSELIEHKNELMAQGKSVIAQRAIPEKLRYREIIYLIGSN